MTKDCCTACQDGHDCDKQRLPVAQAQGIVVLQQATSTLGALEAGDMFVWGPASVEAVSQDAKLVRMEAIEAALPAAFRDGGLISILHKDQRVGSYYPLVGLSADRAPTPEVRRLVEYLDQAYGGAPTAVLPVTQEIVEAFPRLEPFLGTRQFFAGGIIYGTTDTQRSVQEEIRQGGLDSFSIAGFANQTRELELCTPREGCKNVTEVLQLDMSAITLGSVEKNTGPFSMQVRNPGAEFLLVQQAKESVHPKTAPPRESTQTAMPTDPNAPTPGALEQADEPEEGMDRLQDIEKRLDALAESVATLMAGATPTEEAEDEDSGEENDQPDEEKDDPVEQGKVLAQAITTAMKPVLTRVMSIEKRLEQATVTETPAPGNPRNPEENHAAKIEQAILNGDTAGLLKVLRAQAVNA